VVCDGHAGVRFEVPASSDEHADKIAVPISAEEPISSDRLDNPVGTCAPLWSSRPSVTCHRPIIEPFIIQLFQSPLMCWRIQVTMSSHHDTAGTPLAPDWTHDRQLDNIRSGSPHIIEPII
jgi:hypothetical protein